MPVIVSTAPCPALETRPYGWFALLAFLGFYLVPYCLMLSQAPSYVSREIRSISFTLRGPGAHFSVTTTCLVILFVWVIVCIDGSWGHRIFTIADLVFIASLTFSNGADYIEVDRAARETDPWFEALSDDQKWAKFQDVDASRNVLAKKMHRFFAGALFTLFITGAWLAFYYDFSDNPNVATQSPLYNAALAFLILMNFLLVMLVASLFRWYPERPPQWNTLTSLAEHLYVVMAIVFIAIIPSTTTVSS